MKLIGIEDLPGNLGVKLEDSFRKDFFDRAISKAGSVRKLSIILKCHRDSVRLWKKGKILTKISLLKKLTEFTKNDLTTIESKIVAIRNKRVSRKDFIKIKLPIFSSSELASLVGHIIGDGTLGKKQMSFFNQSRELVDEVINNTHIAFSTDVLPKEFEKSNGWEIEFPKNISRLLKIVGVPLGEKVATDFRIPEWIKNGDLEIKRNFIRALFDDESWVDIEGKTIVFGMSKIEKLLTQHKIFLDDLKGLLNEFGVESNPLQKPQLNASGTFHVCFSIKNNLSNITNFSKNIGFTDVKKSKNLLEIINKSNLNNQI